jgi:mono/diheme cytochrome c family protein
MRNMKKLFYFNGMLCLSAIIGILANIRIASCQTGKEQQFPIPEDVNNIFQTSCMPCHGSDGGRYPKSRLNFSRWAGYDTVKKAEKASSICARVRKGTMPPKIVRDSKPELIPTKEQIDLICTWAETLKSKKGKK